METPENKRPTEVCTMTIVFPVLCDEEVLSIRKKVRALLEDIPDVMLDFHIRGIPKHGPPIR